MSSPKEVADALAVEIVDEVKALNQKARSWARRAVNIMRNHELEVLGKDGSGRVYKRGNVRHTASAPGQPPAPDTGNLRRNWRQYVLTEPHLNGVKITCRLKSDTRYAEYLEHGTRHMAARPYEEKVKDESMPEIDALYDGLG